MCATCTRLIAAGLLIPNRRNRFGQMALTPRGEAVSAALPDTATGEDLWHALEAAAARHEAGESLPTFLEGPRKVQ